MVSSLPTLIAIAVLLPLLGALVFRRVASDYDRYGSLGRMTNLMQAFVFVLHFAVSFVFLESTLSALDTSNPLFGFAMILLVGGIVLLVTARVQFGIRKTFGRGTPGLTCSGMYRKSRNPQVIFYGLMVIGYSLLWPSWTGGLWVVMWAILASMMVRTEEQHLKKAYGSEYVDYCTRTPRYMDLPGMK
jgi:protein-S-isoprenylcysteine O-methyltransferase Ste14